MSKLLRIEDVAKVTGYGLQTCYQYHSRGILPPPRKKVGTVLFFAMADIRFWQKNHTARPNARKSVRRKR